MNLRIAFVLLLVGCATLPPAERAQRAMEKGKDLREHHKLMDALKAYKEAIDADPTNLSALHGYIETSKDVGHLKEAMNRFRARLTVVPGDPIAHEGLGLAFYAAGADQAPAAESELAKAAQLDPTEPDYDYRLGVFYLESDRYDEAKAPLGKAVQLAPKNARYRLPYALALARTGNRADAVQQLRTVLTLNPTPEEVVLAEQTGKRLTDPFRGFPQAAREQFEIALNWLDHDAPPQAIQVLESLLQKYPDLAIVHTMLGLAAAKNDDASQAIYSLKRAIELDPDLAEPRAYLGDIYFSRGRPDNAREHYEAAIARNPFLADAYRHLAEVHLKANEPEQAAAQYRTYLLLRPDDIDATLAYCKVLTDSNSPDAAKAWDDAKEHFPRRVDVLVSRARFYFAVAVKSKEPETRTHARKEVIADCEKAVEIDPENTTATGILSEARKL